MKTVLKLLPNNKGQCYPKDKTDKDYFKQIATYYKQEMKLPNSDMYCVRLKNRPPIMMSLALQMKFKKAICRRDYVLIFACLLRAIGIQCRVVQSLVCDPKICPKSELISLSSKAAANVKKSASSTSNKSSKSSKPAPKSSKSKVKIPQLDGNDDVPRKRVKSAKEDYYSPKKLRSAHTKTFSPKVKVTVESPNRIAKSSSGSSASSVKLKNGSDKISETAKKNRALEMTKKATLDIYSPRKTRSMSRDEPPKPESSSQSSKSSSSTSIKSNGEKNATSTLTSKSSSSSKKSSAESLSKTPSAQSVKSTKSSSSTSIKSTDSKKETLKISLPRTTRSRSREEEAQKTASKPNLSKLSLKRKATDKSDESTAPKVPKVVENKASTSRKREASSKADHVDKKKARVSKMSESSEDGSLKLFKMDKPSTSGAKKSKSSANTSKIDRRVLSSEDDTEMSLNFGASPRKSKGIDIWVEAYSEKEEKWIAIDVFRGKVDCVTEIVRNATHPLVYVLAWNNDNSIKDVSARYVKDLNTRIRKMRVDRQYLNSILHLFAGARTSRDFKEDDELNKLQFDAGMPKSIAE